MSSFPTFFNVPRPVQPPHGAGVTVLPLNLIALIISHLDNVADLARVCQTSRVLHYMTLPQLYRNMTLTSYERIRYKDDLAEGIGSASPFSMGLNALVTRNVASLVRTLSLQGHWREHDLDEYSRAGRVPDSAMMLNIALRAAVDRCTLLEAFKWDLNTKLLPNVYTGLAALRHLESFYLRFPSSRSPRPMIEIPPMPNLRSFTFAEYDPLCFPDDISTLLFHATRLEELKMHFSPRMRDAGEPSVQLLHFFRKNIAAKRPLKPKTFHMYNLFALSQRHEIGDALDSTAFEDVAFLNTFGSEGDDTASPYAPSGAANSGFLSFIDSSWHPPDEIGIPKCFRHDRLSKLVAKQIASVSGLERLYLVNARHKPPSASNGFTANGTQNGSGNAAAGRSLSTSPNNSLTPPCAPSGPTASTVLRDLYIDALCLRHGATLRHLILPARWQLPTSIIARLFRSCPHITQLALAMECSSFEGMRMLVPFLTKLWAIRILVPEEQCDRPREVFDPLLDLEDEKHERIMSTELAKDDDFPELRYIGLAGKVWEIGAAYEIVETVVDEESGEERKETVLRRRIRRVGLEEVREVEIWQMDSLDIV